MIIGLLLPRTVVPKRARTEVGLVGRQRNLESPGRPGQKIQRTNHTTHTAIRMRECLKINGRSAVGRMANNPVIGFDAPARPGAPHGYIPKLDHLVVVYKIAAAGFLLRRPYFATDLRKNQHFDVGIFERHYLPRHVDRLICIAVKAMVGIQPPKQRDRTRIGKGVSRKNLFVHLYRSSRLLSSQIEHTAERP